MPLQFYLALALVADVLAPPLLSQISCESTSLLSRRGILTANIRVDLARRIQAGIDAGRLPAANRDQFVNLACMLLLLATDEKVGKEVLQQFAEFGRLCSERST